MYEARREELKVKVEKVKDDKLTSNEEKAILVKEMYGRQKEVKEIYKKVLAHIDDLPQGFSLGYTYDVCRVVDYLQPIMNFT